MSRNVTRSCVLLPMFWLLFFAHNVAAVTLESFLEPNKKVDIVPVNRDIVREVHVVEGESVKAGQLLVTLDLGVLNAQHDTAKILASNRGQLDSAAIMVEMRKAQLENLNRLESTGHVRPNELEKTRADLALAQADLLTAKESRKIRLAELKQIEAQIEVKKIRAPIDGVVSRIFKTEGELVGLNDEDALITVVQALPLHVIFHIPYNFMGNLASGQKVTLHVNGQDEMVTGTVLYFSPLVNPESGTVRVKIGFADNFAAKSGIRCSFETNQLLP
ncbi:efflux RND transporter periplasmic adaptor subunit [Desulforhopalus sp. IMCC35007]|uniref:efflux RND transporter periplasmic adaptor subunit n=1 Tax=Desulforhopalus sp. IMCC35007 TaxID=2569543 RepID=UPI00145E0810|nr:efflux RND transporter periplasmic adaptor subunit [Desulforhopalus sp. IMCC35007]